MQDMAATLQEVARLRAELPEAIPYARIVGRWVWVEYPEKPDGQTRAALKRLGYHWSRRRGAWQHPCGWRSRRSSRDPRAHYGVVPAVAVLAEDE